MIYFDHNATSPPTAEHLKQLLDTLSKEQPANPSSPHALGRAASVLLTQTRKSLAQALGAEVGEIIFTSGGTEANNLGVKAVIEKKLLTQGLNHDLGTVSVITTAFEHPSILKQFEQIKQKYPDKIEVIYIEPNQNGHILASDIVSKIKKNTILVTVMAANNEIGTIQPVKEIGDFLNEKRWQSKSNIKKFDDLSQYLSADVSSKTLQDIHFHVDAIQMFGKIPAKTWMSPGFDSVSISGHKLGALQGVGALILRRGRNFLPLVSGGAQEKNRRAGTENIPGIVSFGLICKRLHLESYWSQIQKIKALCQFVHDKLSQNKHIVLNSTADGLPNTIHFSLNSGYRAEDLILKLDMNGICVSSGSACSSGVNLPSHVVLSLGKEKSYASNSLRISLGLEVTKPDIQNFLKHLSDFFANKI